MRDYLDWKAEEVFEHVAAIDNVSTSADLSGGDGEPERVQMAIVTEDYFDVLGASPVVGRTLLPEDYAQAGPARALVISHGIVAAALRRRFANHRAEYIPERPPLPVGRSDAADRFGRTTGM